MLSEKLTNQITKNQCAWICRREFLNIFPLIWSIFLTVRVMKNFQLRIFKLLLGLSFSLGKVFYYGAIFTALQFWTIITRASMSWGNQNGLVRSHIKCSLHSPNEDWGKNILLLWTKYILKWIIMSKLSNNKVLFKE